MSEEDNVELEHPTVGDAVRAAGEGEEVEQSSNRRVTPKESVSQAVVDSEDKRENGEYVSREVKGSANAPANDKQQQTDMKIPIRTETLSRYKTADTNSTAILDSVKNANNSTTNAPQANSTSSATLSPKNTTSTTTTDQDTKENKDLLDLKPTGPMSASQMIAEARSQSNKLLKGSFIEFVEWLFVIILVAPGTFPAMACIVLSCATFWRRRLGIPSPLEGPGRSSDAEGDGGEWDEPVGHLRAGVGSGEHGALIARGRSSGGG